MRQLFFFLIFLCLHLCSAAQANDYCQVAFQMKNLPVTEKISVSDIAEYITHHFSNPDDKVAAAYYWVVNNIRYSADSVYTLNWETTNEVKLSATLRRKKGVCLNFALLYNEVLDRCGFQTILVEGQTKQNGLADKNGHAWSAVQIRKKWYLFDPTWDEGAGIAFSWFMQRPSEFIQSHLPFDPLFQFLQPLVAERDFLRSIIVSEGLNEEHANEELVSFLKQPHSLRYEGQYARISATGSKSSLVKIQMAVIRMQTATLNGEHCAVAYDAAVTDFNEAVKIYNESFAAADETSLPGSALKEALAALVTADERISEIRKMQNNDQYNPDVLSEKIGSLRKKIEQRLQVLQPDTTSHLFEAQPVN